MFILVIGSVEFEYARAIVAAAGNAARKRLDVNVRFSRSVHARPGNPKIAVADGFIVDRPNPTFEEAGKPVVTYSTASDAYPEVPCVAVDNSRVGQLQAQHLITRGYPAVAFFGRTQRYAMQRRAGFEAEAARAGIPFHPTTALPEAATLRHDTLRRDWHEPLATLPKPVGIGCATDAVALSVSEACGDLKLRIPEDVGIIGVDDDQLYCLFADPPLSSVPQPTEAIGAAALDLVCRLIQGEPVGENPVLFPPLPVVERESTALRAVSDDLVRQALELMERSLHECISVEDILRRLGVSRSWLSKRFNDAIGRTPYQELMRQRMLRAQQLLTGTKWSVSDIARQCGFSSQGQFAVAFRKATGVTPSEYRRSREARPPSPVSDR